jgi:Tol biopolymer transport system component/nitrogen regulatory protein PII-like uncharacterized protein
MKDSLIMKILNKLLYISLLLCTNKLMIAQPVTYNHPELDWYTIETDHFKVHFHKGAERTGRTVAKIAEDIYQPITDLYGYEPDGIIHFIIKDYDDNANGAAFYYDNKVEIWAPKMTFILRGTHNWLRNVVTHEFAHMISLGASRKLPRRIPSLFFQVFNYEKEKRPDVLYGYPNVIASYPIPMTVIPMWLAEGMAQYQIDGLDYDRWDTHRDMLIRTAILQDKSLTLDQMGVFGKNSLGNERTYNAGYAFTRYIAKNWGPESLAKLANNLTKPFTFSVDGALKSVTGIDGGDLYEQWHQNMVQYYEKRLQKIMPNTRKGEIITKKGIGNVYPAWSPDGSKIAFCGGKASDYLSMTSLKLYNVKTKKEKTLKGGINSVISWSPDGTQLAYARRNSVDHGSYVYDLFIYDLEKEKEKQITRGKRLVEPDWHPDADRFVAVTQKDGTDNLVVVTIDSGNIEPLTRFRHGEGIYSPRWSPDGKSIVFVQSRNHGREINLLSLEDGSIENLVRDTNDARDVTIAPDGKQIYFSWDKSGVYNIYSMNLQDSTFHQWTNVTGGAFMPHVNESGDITYSDFAYDGYKISLLTSPETVDSDHAEYVNITPQDELYKLGLDDDPKISDDEHINHIANFDDTLLPGIETEPYSMTYGTLAFLPRVMVDSNRVKLGTYFYASDILDKYSLLGGVALNAVKDLDAFAIVEYRGLTPTLFVELYANTRNIKRSISVIEDYPEQVGVDIGFTMLEGDIGGQFHPTRSQTVRTTVAHTRYTSQIKKFLFQNQEWVSPRNTYFKGTRVQVDWSLNGIMPGVTSSIAPSAGRKIDFTYAYEWNDFFKDFSTNNDYGTLQEVYSDYDYHRIELDWNEYLTNPLFSSHSLGMNIQGGWIDRPVDSFFYFFGGGLPGIRGYPFYSIEGRKKLITRWTYRLPIFRQWQKRFLHFTTDNLYLGAFLDYGNTFNEDQIRLQEFKKAVGLNLRLSGFSFYGYPTAFSIDAAYGLDSITYRDRDTLEDFTYGKEWRFYFTLLFDFLD